MAEVTGSSPVAPIDFSLQAFWFAAFFRLSIQIRDDEGGVTGE